MASGVLSGDAAPVGSVRWIDANRKPVMVLQDDRDATIIWVIEKPHGAERRSARCGGIDARAAPARRRRWRLALRGRPRLAQPLVPPEPGGFDAKPNKPRLHFEVTVLHASPSPGGVGPGAERFDRLLRDTVRYESLRVVKTKERRVELNEIERIALPTGQDFRFRPIDAGRPRGAGRRSTGRRRPAATSGCRAASP